MKRRAILSGVASGLAWGLTGCLGGDQEESDDGESTNQSAQPSDLEPPDRLPLEEYERCDNRIVRIENLPDAAAFEATAALDYGAYETADDLLLAEVIHVEEVFLREDDTYYAVEITEMADETRLELVEELPTFQEPVTFENMLDDPVTADITVVHEETGETLLDERLDLEAGEIIELNDEVAFPFGSYHLELASQELSEEYDWEITWTLDQRFESGYAYPIELDDGGVYEDPVDRDSSYGPCRWDDDGNVSTAH